METNTTPGEEIISGNTVSPVYKQNVPPQSTKKPFFSSKLFILIIVLAILIIGSTGTYYFLNSKNTKPQIANNQTNPSPKSISPTPTDETANWNTYKDTQLGFTFKYPPEVLTPDKNGIVRATSSKDEYLQISFVTSGVFQDPTTALNNAIRDGEAGGMYLSKYIGKTKIGGKEALTYFTSNPHDPDDLTIVMPPYKAYAIYSNTMLDGKDAINVFRIEYFANKQNAKIFEEILSTFKFINSNLTPAPTISVSQNYPTSTCMPRPACLDATPRCMIAEPANGWCP